MRSFIWGKEVGNSNVFQTRSLRSSILMFTYVYLLLIHISYLSSECVGINVTCITQTDLHRLVLKYTKTLKFLALHYEPTDLHSLGC
jgi:hypothetical protein